MTSGSMPVTAQERRLSRGARPRSRPRERRMSSTAAAPSLMPDELPAVTEPSFWKTGLSLASCSREVCARVLVLRERLARARQRRPRRSARRSAPPRSRSRGALLALQRECVLLRARDAVALGDLLGGDAHVVVAEGVGDQRERPVDRARASRVASRRARRSRGTAGGSSTRRRRRRRPLPGRTGSTARR